MRRCVDAVTVYEERQAEKERWEQYREACARLYPDAHMRHLVAVSETADRDGAFIEISVWIPKDALLCASVRAVDSLRCSLLPGHSEVHYDDVRKLYFLGDGEQRL